MIWFDLDNSPHVPLFKPVINELKNRNIESIISAREYAQTIDLLELWNIKYTLIGKHAGKNKFNKIINLFGRANNLRNFIRKKKINLAVSHGSRTQVLASRISGIKSVVMMDYEYTENRIFNYLSNYILMPAVFTENRLKDAGINIKKIIKYNGLKEEIYLKYFEPDSNFRCNNGFSDKDIIIVIRPPAFLSNYHHEKSEKILYTAINHLSSFKDVKIVLLFRTEADKSSILKYTEKKENIKFLNNTVDGLQLLFASDITLSGGGTMNRESALLGTDTYSFFTGKRPFIDEFLFENKKLNFINSANDIYNIEVKRKPKSVYIHTNNSLIQEIIDIFINLINTGAKH
jgi:predicted glycosyltransferase